MHCLTSGVSGLGRQCCNLVIALHLLSAQATSKGEVLPEQMNEDLRASLKKVLDCLRDKSYVHRDLQNILTILSECWTLIGWLLWKCKIPTWFEPEFMMRMAWKCSCSRYYTGNKGELSAVYCNSLYFVVKMFSYTENIHILREYNFTTRIFPTLVGSVLHTSTFPKCCCPYTYPCIRGSL